MIYTTYKRSKTHLLLGESEKCLKPPCCYNLLIFSTLGPMIKTQCVTPVPVVDLNFKALPVIISGNLNCPIKLILSACFPVEWIALSAQ